MPETNEPRLQRTVGLRLTAIFLMFAAFCSIGFPFACILRYTLKGSYSVRLWEDYLPLEVVFLPLAILLGSVGYGLWYRRKWAIAVGLGFAWLVAVGGTLGVLYGLCVTATSSGWGRGIAFAATASVFAFTIPAWLLIWRLKTLR